MMFWFVFWVVKFYVTPDAINRQRNSCLFYMQDKIGKFHVKEIKDQYKLEVYSDGGL